MKAGEMICKVPAALLVERCDAPAHPVEARPPLAFARPRADGFRVTPVFTLVLWLGCSVIAALGFALPYVRPQAAKPAAAPLQVEMLAVELSHELHELPSLPAEFSADAALPEAIFQPQVAQVIPVAAPSPTIAFAVPVEGPVRIVPATQASYSRPETSRAPVVAQPPVEPLVFGQGAGRQPSPAYPLAAQRAGQEGAVQVRFVVAENGRVTAAEAVAPSPWPMLNDSALRTIRNRWRFPDGTMRAYEVAIRFVLPK